MFVSGHPGSTNRLETLARLKHRRDFTLPYWLAKLRYLEALLLQFSEQGPDRARRAQGDLYRVANTRKAITGQYQGLLNPVILKSKQARHLKMREPEINLYPHGADLTVDFAVSERFDYTPSATPDEMKREVHAMRFVGRCRGVLVPRASCP